jgi:HSP20 family protein
MNKNWNWTKDEQPLSNIMPVQGIRGNLASPLPYVTPIASFYQDIDRMFDQVLRGFGVPSLWSGRNNMMFVPNVDISSTDNEYTIDVEVPGLSENDIRIELLKDGQLCICGEKRLENENQDKDFQRIERSYGSFSRTLSLPDDADPEAIRAEFNNGVLTIIVPRRESFASQGKRIEIGEGRPARGGRQQQRHEGRAEGQQGSGSANTNINPKRVA